MLSITVIAAYGEDQHYYDNGYYITEEDDMRSRMQRQRIQMEDMKIDQEQRDNNLFFERLDRENPYDYYSR
jgi:hypothetical protein